jgi:hypothetical protein
MSDHGIPLSVPTEQRIIAEVLGGMHGQAKRTGALEAPVRKEESDARV